MSWLLGNKHGQSHDEIRQADCTTPVHVDAIASTKSDHFAQLFFSSLLPMLRWMSNFSTSADLLPHTMASISVTSSFAPLLVLLQLHEISTAPRPSGSRELSLLPPLRTNTHCRRTKRVKVLVEGAESGTNTALSDGVAVSRNQRTTQMNEFSFVSHNPRPEQLLCRVR
jgi:hypothetical protein